MYSECASLTDSLHECALPRVVLNSYPSSVARDVVRCVLGPLVDLLKSRGESAAPGGEGAVGSLLRTREEVEWTMEVLGYGLHLPLADHELITSCIDVYEDWLTSVFSPSSTVPAPINENPGHYARIIFSHFYQLFVSQGHSSELSRTPAFSLSVSPDSQFSVCQRILALTQTVLMKPSQRVAEEVCEAISKHLLTVADVLLSPPIDPYFPTLATRLSDQLIHVLFEAWLRACTTSFPLPHLWKSLRELCVRWRHHPCLSEQWSAMMYSLTLRVVRQLYSPSYLDHLHGHLQEDTEFAEILQSVPPDSLVQCWFRMLHTLGNPVEISYLSAFSSLPSFQKTVAESGDSLSTTALGLPHIFHEAMRGLARLVYLFLGQEQQREEPHPPSEGSAPNTPLPVRPSPIGLRRKNSREYRDKSSVSGSSGGLPQSKKPSTMWYTPSPKLLPPPLPQITPLTQPHSLDIKRPSGNTLLHLFGSWLFEAASRPLHLRGSEAKKRDSKRSAVFHSLVDLNASIDSTQTTPLDDQAQFEAGRAEAFGALCAVFSSQPCGEPFLPVYLGWFYQSLSLGLQHDESSQGLMMTRILLNSSSLFRKGLPGINLLLPHFLAALDHVLPHAEPQVRCEVGKRELRHSSIQLILSILPLPLHFLHQPLPALPDLSLHVEGLRSGVREGATFYSLREWMLWLLFSAIEHERDGGNMQLLLHGVLVSLQDTVTYENAVSKETVDEGDNSATCQRSNILSSVDKDYGSAGLFRRACKAAHCCLLSWEDNVHISLSALELLQGLAQLQFEYIDHVDLKQTVMWVCGYIEHRAVKDHLQHSKDLHTSIVAAFSCLLSWITLHPYLLGDKSALNAVMQVVELGISGTFSQQSPSGDTTYKGEKELKPISGRVKDIAEFVLTTIIEQVGAFPPPCGAESSSSLLNEEHLLARLPVRENMIDAQFKYVLLDNETILGLLEVPFADATPSVTAIMRGPSGRHCWNMQLHMRPRSGPVPPLPQTVPRPTPSSPLPPPPSSSSSSSSSSTPWPEEATHTPELLLDRSIPSLDAVLNEDSREEYERMAALVSQQIELEADTLTTSHVTPSHPHSSHISLEPPHRAKDTIDTARLILNHLNLLGLDTLQPLQAGQKPSIVMLDHTNPSFKQALIGLDRLPTRFCNTVFILHCREGFCNAEDILAQQTLSTGRPPEFTEFVLGLGWSVDPLSHAGFAGKIRPDSADDAGHLLQFGAQIPTQPFPYYADSITEMAFVQPSLRPSASHSSASLRSTESSDSGQDTVSMASKSSLPPPSEREPLSSQTSLPFLHHVNQPTAEGDRFHTLPTRGRQISGSRSDVHSTDTSRKKSAVPQDCAVIVAWLDRFEDRSSFPLETLSAVLHSGSVSGRGAQRRALPCIFIHMLPSGLYQVTTSAPRMESLAGPLLEGMVVSRRSLSRLVRLTAANMCGRHRLDNEGYCPPHVKRKRRIEEMAALFSKHMPVPDFYSKLLLRDAYESLASS